ncbi:MAG: ATP-binding protein [Shimia sp.]|uniref:ATP-binding protein n=1 Tax=Shimia sp. TaxID=1954381 RepID=UPI004059C061
MSSPITSDGAPLSIEEAIVATRQEKERLALYVDDRIARTKIRIGLYLFGCVMAYLALGFWLSVAAFALLTISDFIDVFLLKRYVGPLARKGKVRKAQALAFWGGVSQGLGFALAPAFYFFNVPNPDIIFVIGALGFGAVNAAIVLPQNRSVGMTRLTIYFCTPVTMIWVHTLIFDAWKPVVINDTAIMMLLGCMIYMIVTFGKAGMINHRINRDLFRSREDIKTANAHMARQQAEMRQLSQVARKANDSVIITNRDREILWVNEAFERFSGYTSEEAIGKGVAALMTQGDTDILADNAIDLAVTRGEGYRGTVQSIRKNGGRYWLDVNLFPIFDEDGTLEFYVSIERDVTEARRLATEMEDARAQAEAGARAKAEFLANMSHEIRTPLSGVLGMADLLAESKLDAEQQRFADTIRGSSMSLMAIINDILDLSKLDAGRMELHPVAFSPKACFQQTFDLLATAARNKGIDLVLESADGVPALVKADDGRIRQVATNIIGNAIKFTESGSVTLRLRTEEDAWLCFDVSDTGIGIPKEKLHLIFDHFTQAEASTTRRFGGSGLGLSISRHIVEVMGGQITVASEMGVGSTFKVRVPIEVLATSSEHPAKLTGSRAVSGGIKLQAGLSILIAEDNQTNQFLLKKYLKDQPITLEFANDGVEALDLAATRPFDLIFMDM